MCRILTMLTIFWVFTNPLHAAVPTASQIEQSRIYALGWLIQNQKGDGRWHSASGESVRTTSEVLLALSNSGISEGFIYNAALAFLQNTNTASVDSLARKIIALEAGGFDVTTFTEQLKTYQNHNNAWGAYPFYGSSLPDTPLAIIALLQAGELNVSALALEKMLCKGILYAQQNDNSFSYVVNGFNAPTGLAQGSITPTAYAIMALNAVQSVTGLSNVSCNRIENGVTVTTSYALSEVVDNGIIWLLSLQHTIDGGFSLNGDSNVLSTLMAYNAINQVAATTYAVELGNALSFLLTQQNSNGGWLNNPLLTSFVAQALPTLNQNALADVDADGVPDDVEIFLNTNPLVADRKLASGNGSGVLAVNFANTLDNARQFLNYSESLGVDGGTPPYLWSIIAGFLPDGLELNTGNGAITGRPTIAGTFNFSYRVTDMSGGVGTATIQITVDEAEAFAVPTLPFWALLMLLLLLFITQISMQKTLLLKSNQ